jgi:DNA-binding GntR family transcriptional regulator
MSRVSGASELIRSMILRGEIPAGARLPEAQIADRLRIGRSTLREGLRRLEGDGLLVANPSGGMRVVRLDAAELEATLHVRAALEALSAGLAAERVRTGELPPEAALQLGALADEADSVARTGAPEPATLADRTFHRAVDALAANGPCREALTRLWDRILVAAAQPAGGPAHRGGADQDHRGLLAAIAAGDGEAASSLARRHVLATVG